MRVKSMQSGGVMSQAVTHDVLNHSSQRQALDVVDAGKARPHSARSSWRPHDWAAHLHGR